MESKKYASEKGGNKRKRILGEKKDEFCLLPGKAVSPTGLSFSTRKSMENVHGLQYRGEGRL